MICPCCGGKPLSFAEFWTGINAVRVKCDKCGCKLKANKVTWTWLSLCICGLVLFFVYLFATIGKFVLADDYGKPGIFIFVLLCAVLSWFTGGYVPVAPKKGHQREKGG